MEDFLFSSKNLYEVVALYFSKLKICTHTPKLFWIQLAVLVLTLAFAATVLFLANTWILSGASTAVAVLTQYVLWLRLLRWSSVLMLVIALAVNIIGIHRLIRTGYFCSKCIGMAALGISVPFLIFLMINSATSSMISNIEEDITAIETGHLIEDYYAFDMDWENFYRKSSLNDFGGYRILYVADNETIGRHYFPASLSPATLSDMSRCQKYQHSNAPDTFRILRIAYTPNFQVIVSAEPVSEH